LGICYANGFGVPKDADKAVKLYRAAAAAGFTTALANLGLQYRKGEGVPQDMLKPCVVRKGADQGSRSGTSWIAIM